MAANYGMEWIDVNQVVEVAMRHGQKSIIFETNFYFSFDPRSILL